LPAVTDVNLAGTVTGAELAKVAAERYPKMRIIVTSGRGSPPASALFMAKPWNPEAVVREAKAACRC
jgi:two-component system cell cycle response regulator CpdR